MTWNRAFICFSWSNRLCVCVCVCERERERVNRWNYPCNSAWRPMRYWDIEAPTFSRKSAHRWRWGCQPYAPAGCSLPPGRFLVLISVSSWLHYKAIARLQVIAQLKNPMTSTEIDLPACSTHTVPQPNTLQCAPWCGRLKYSTLHEGDGIRLSICIY
jgi:hypothetical protein